VFFEDLGHVHECGFVFDEQEFEEWINSVAALVLDQDGLPIAAVAVARPAYRLTRERMIEIGSSVLAAAPDITEGMEFTAHH
jgi:IclR family acetate operon transcriptional repressor